MSPGEEPGKKNNMKKSSEAFKSKQPLLENEIQYDEA